ncbi:MAG TPA: hydroxyisourate hydrolase [Gemmataceae bacterium]|nr:hydroxyisourate hydrolase [Gemmataceae bacterium]
MLSLFAWLLLGPVLMAEPKAPPPARKRPVTTHVLNTASGKPGAGVSVTLQRQADNGWEEVGKGRTDDDGRAGDLYPADKPLAAGVYRLVFETGAYFKAQGQKTFFPRVEIIFQVEKVDEHYHVPLLLSPFGYTTYRGS